MNADGKYAARFLRLLRFFVAIHFLPWRGTMAATKRKSQKLKEPLRSTNPLDTRLVFPVLSAPIRAIRGSNSFYSFGFFFAQNLARRSRTSSGTGLALMNCAVS
jgi:hypothetical protein